MTGRIRLCRDDVLLLCSDGLSGKLRAEDMHQILVNSVRDLEAACEAMIEEANARGGEDNITVVLARFGGEDLPVSQSDDIFIEHLRWPHEEMMMMDDDDTSDDTEAGPRSI
ncbi:MAG: hypothetical protein WKF84_12245 [Pyrinomonadaceae bacterium]